MRALSLSLCSLGCAALGTSDVLCDSSTRSAHLRFANPAREERALSQTICCSQCHKLLRRADVPGLSLQFCQSVHQAALGQVQYRRHSSIGNTFMATKEWRVDAAMLSHTVGSGLLIGDRGGLCSALLGSVDGRWLNSSSLRSCAQCGYTVSNAST